MSVICQKCGQGITNGFNCGCGVNQNAVGAFISKGGQRSGIPTPKAVANVSGESKAIEPATGAATAATGSPNVQNEVTSLEGQIAGLRAETKRVDDEITALCKQRNATSSLEWYLFAIDRVYVASGPIAPTWLHALSTHIVAWLLVGYVWIPIGYIMWLTRHSERADWDKAVVQKVNNKVNDQIKSLRNQRTALLSQVEELRNRLKEYIGKGYVPTWTNNPSDAAKGAVSGVLSGAGSFVSSLVNAVPVGTCPSCKQNWAKEADGENPLNTEFHPGFTTEKGKGFEREVIFVEKVQHYEEKFKCKKCSHCWRVRKVRRIVLREACPKCFRDGSRQLGRCEDLGHEDTLRTVQREAGHYDKDRQYVGSTFQSVQVAVRTEHCRQFYRCTSCDHEWSEKSNRTFTL